MCLTIIDILKIFFGKQSKNGILYVYNLFLYYLFMIIITLLFIFTLNLLNVKYIIFKYIPNSITVPVWQRADELRVPGGLRRARAALQAGAAAQAQALPPARPAAAPAPAAS